MTLSAACPVRTDPVRQSSAADGNSSVAARIARAARPVAIEAGNHAMPAIRPAVSAEVCVGDEGGGSTALQVDAEDRALTAACAGNDDDASTAARTDDESDALAAMRTGNENSASTAVRAGDEGVAATTTQAGHENGAPIAALTDNAGDASAAMPAGNEDDAASMAPTGDRGDASTAVRAGNESSAPMAACADHEDDAPATAWTGNEGNAATAMRAGDGGNALTAVRAGNGNDAATTAPAGARDAASTTACAGDEERLAATPRASRHITSSPLSGRLHEDDDRHPVGVHCRQMPLPACVPMAPAATAHPCVSAAARHHRHANACAVPAVAASAPPSPHPPFGFAASPPASAAVPPTADTVLWACFQFPALPLHAVFADEASGERPCALFEGPRQRPVVVHANEAAQARGVRPGLVLATARALCAELDARKREPDAERSALQLLATWAYRFSAQVSRGEPDTVWLEVGASLTLFKGWPALQRQLHAELQTLGFGAYRLGVAPVAAAARVLALSYEQIALRQHAAMQSALERTPIALSGLPAQSIAQLQGMGFRELRDLWRVPRLELTRRLGPAGMHTLAVLRGEAAESLALYQPPDRFARRIELDALVDNWQPLLFPLRRLVNELARYLLVRDGGVQRFELRLEHEDRAATRVPVGLVSVQREAAALYEFCRGRLERAAIGAEVSAIALIADDLPPFRPGHRDLFEPSRSEGLDWPALTERLRSRLGDDALQQLACVADHRPERAWRFVAPGAPAREPAKPTQGGTRKAKPAHADSVRPAGLAAQGTVPGASPGTDAGIGSAPHVARPLWLLPQPIPLRQPLTQILSGPERIESGWWDGGDVRRDYYVVRCASGQRAWAFLPAGAAEGWMLHGWFA